MSRRLAALATLAMLVGACAGASQSSPASAPSGSAAPGSIAADAATTATPESTYLPSFVAQGFPHQDPDLEALLPSTVAGQILATWSVRGKDYFALSGPLDDADLASIEADLALSGLKLDDVSQATAGRSRSADAPYFVVAIRFRGQPAEQWPLWVGVADEASAGSGWTAATIEGKDVQEGTAAMIGESEHARGTPYVYSHDDVRFVVVSERRDWVADALRQLP